MPTRWIPSIVARVRLVVAQWPRLLAKPTTTASVSQKPAASVPAAAAMNSATSEARCSGEAAAVAAS